MFHYVSLHFRNLADVCVYFVSFNPELPVFIFACDIVVYLINLKHITIDFKKHINLLYFVENTCHISDPFRNLVVFRPWFQIFFFEVVWKFPQSFKGTSRLLAK